MDGMVEVLIDIVQHGTSIFYFMLRLLLRILVQFPLVHESHVLVVLIKRKCGNFRWIGREHRWIRNRGFFFRIESFRKDRRQDRRGKECNDVLIHGCLLGDKIRIQFSNKKSSCLFFIV